MLNNIAILSQFLQDLETVMNQIVTEMGHDGTMTAMMEEETAMTEGETVMTEEETAMMEEENVIGIAMMTGTAETLIEEVCYSVYLDPVLEFRSICVYEQWLRFLLS